MYIVLTYFNQIIGPETFFSIPTTIPEEFSKKIGKFLNLDIEEAFYKVVFLDRQLKIINMSFEVPSGWGRGGVEEAMISVITDEDYRSKLFYDLLIEISEKIINRENIYKGFYKFDELRNHDIEVDIKYEEIRYILVKSLEKFIEMLDSLLNQK